MQIQSVNNNNNNIFNIKRSSGTLNLGKYNVSKSLYNSNNIIGANYFSPSFGLKNPQIALERAKLLQANYAAKGLDYRLPDKVWSTKKIMVATQKALDGFDKLCQKGHVNTDDLNDLVAKILPKDISEKIEVKDLFNDYPKYLKSKGCSEKQIESELKYCAGVTISEGEKNKIYLSLNNIDYSPYHKLNCQKTFAHELKHAITNQTTNIINHDKFKLDNKALEDDLYKVFHIMERTYKIDDGLYFSSVELTEDNLIKNLINTKTDKRFTSKEALLKDLKQTWNETISNQKSLVNIDKKIINEFMQHFSKDEKEAYTTTKIMRENTWNKDNPIGAELNVLKYHFFEKFFKQQVSQIKS